MTAPWVSKAAPTSCSRTTPSGAFQTPSNTHTDRRQPLARTVRDSHRPGSPASSNRAAKTERKNRMGATRPVTDETFEAEVLQSTRTVLVDYWAERCGLFKMIAPILEAITEEHGDKLGIVKLNVDENPQV